MNTSSANKARALACGYRSRLPFRRLFVLSVVSVAIAAFAPRPAHAQDDQPTDLAADPIRDQMKGTEDGANVNDDSNRFVYRKYSSNAKTNDRLNAVFNLIRTEGNGLTWDGSDVAQRADLDPVPVPVVARPVNAAPSTAKAVSPGEKVADPIKTASNVTKTIARSTSPAATTQAKPHAAQLAPAPAPLPILTWTFKPHATAEETLASWARIAGWNAPKWEAKNPFQGHGEVQGTFLDALRAFADAAPQLDLHAKLDRREITVTDAR